uniref:Putative secreted protein n=1 Tax=Ixodes ricinus TaxID=34613 RepID=A0A6B0TSW2_IXORI
MPPRMALLVRSATSLSLPANLASSSMASSMQTVESTSKQTQSAALHMARVWLSVRFSVRDPGMLALLLVLVPL